MKIIPKLLLSLTTAILIFTSVGCDRLFPTSGYTVRRVSDGDTLALTDPSGKNFTVRFACVDAPEIPHSTKERNSKKALDKNQFKWGTKSLDRVKQLVKQGGNSVNLTVTDTDRYGRKVSEVRLRDGTFIQQVLVSEGLALVYRPYLKNCPSSAVIQKAEADAQKSKRGVWSDAKFTPPWEYRKASK